MKKNILIIVIVLILLGTAFIWLSYGKNRSASHDPETIESTKIRLSQLRRLKNLKLDTTIFEDPLFRALKESKASPLPDVQIGRTNPFVPF